MRLVIEEMGDEEPLRRANLTLRGAAEPHHVLVEPGVVDRGRPARDGGIGRVARRAQLGEIRDEMVALFDRRRRRRPTVKPAYPLAVAPQEVDERAVDRAPEGA